MVLGFLSWPIGPSRIRKNSWNQKLWHINDNNTFKDLSSAMPPSMICKRSGWHSSICFLVQSRTAIGKDIQSPWTTGTGACTFTNDSLGIDPKLHEKIDNNFIRNLWSTHSPKHFEKTREIESFILMNKIHSGYFIFLFISLISKHLRLPLVRSWSQKIVENRHVFAIFGMLLCQNFSSL